MKHPVYLNIFNFITLLHIQLKTSVGQIGVDSLQMETDVTEQTVETQRGDTW